MSFAMDDLNRSYGVDPALQSRLIEEARNAEKTAGIQDADSKKEEPVVDDVFEASPPQKLTPDPNSLTSIQEKSTSIDIVNKFLNKIASYVENIKSAIADGDSEQKIKVNYKKIIKIAKETSFNDKQLVKTDENSNNDLIISLKEMKISDIKNLEIDTSEQREKSLKKLNEVIDNIKRKQQELADSQKKLAAMVNENSLVEIKQTPEEEREDKKQEISAEKLKEAAIKSIKEHPEESRRIQIKHLDRNLLLAMISLKGA